MKKFINAVDAVEKEMISGMCKAHPGYIRELDCGGELVPAGKGIVDFAEVKRLMELEGVAPRYTVHYDYDFPEEEAGARRFASDDLRHYRSVLG